MNIISIITIANAGVIITIIDITTLFLLIISISLTPPITHVPAQHCKY